MHGLWNKLVNRETISYLIFGVLTTLVNLVVYGVIAADGIDYRAATAIAWAVAVLFAFVVNKIFVFQSYDMHMEQVMRELVPFTACRIASGVMEMAFMIAMVSGLHFDKYASKVIVSVFVVIANYVFSKLFIFKKKPCEES